MWIIVSQPNGRNRGGGREMAMPNIRICHLDWQSESHQLNQKSNITILVQSLTIHIKYFKLFTPEVSDY